MPRRKMGGASRIRGGRPGARPRGVTHRPAVTRSPRRSSSPKRAQTRRAKRVQHHRKAAKINTRSRPAVRPARVARKRMPSAKLHQTSRPAVRPAAGSASRRASRSQVRRAVRPVRAAARPATNRAIKRGLTQAVGTAAAVAAVNQLMQLNTSAAHPSIAYQVNTLQSTIDELSARADMSEVRADIANLNANLNHVVSLLESAREKGYRYQGDLEDIAYDAMSRWQAVRDDVEASIKKQAGMVSSFIGPVNQQISRLNGVVSSAVGADSVLADAENEIQQALGRVQDAESAIEAVYDDIEQQVSLLTIRLTRIHWALTQLAEASFDRMPEEDLYMAVKARWDKEGKDDPEGVLFLTNKRLIFEQKEKMATKKVLFVATAKELVQKVLGAQPLSEIENVKAENKGVFGHQDYLVVDFGEQRVPFHLDGQDSKDWAQWVNHAKSGKIEDERATGSKLSFSDLTGPLTEADILDLQHEINELQDEMMLKNLQSEISELENQVSSLSRELSDLRARGYLVEKSLESDVEVLILQWEQIKSRTKTTLDYQTEQLGGTMKEIQTGMAKLAGMTGSLAAARPVYVNLKSMIASAEAQAEAAEETVLDQYDEYAEEVETLDAHLEWVDWMLDALETASFKLLATESGVAALEAVWEPPARDPENGVLFLTDQRLLWEDREGDFELKIDLPLAAILGADKKIEEDERIERLVVEMGGKAPYPTGIFLLSQPLAEEWLQMIGRARSGGYAADRSEEIDKSLLERIQAAPTQCPNCGAAFTAPILRGQEEIVCEFCGVATRI